MHVFGHTHIARDEVVDGTRYVQQPLGYPKERKRWGLRLRLPKLVFETNETRVEEGASGAGGRADAAGQQQQMAGMAGAAGSRAGAAAAER